MLTKEYLEKWEFVMKLEFEKLAIQYKANIVKEFLKQELREKTTTTTKTQK